MKLDDDVLEEKQRIKEQAIKFIEYGLLRMLYIKGILSEEEYNGIREIAEEHQ